MFNTDFTRSLLEKIGGNSATIVLDGSGVCVFASSAAENTLGKNPAELLGKRFVETLHLYSMEGQPVEDLKHPVTKALTIPEYVQTTPFFCKLESDENADTYALSTIQIADSDSKKIANVIIQMRKAKREVKVGEMKSLFLSFAAHQLKTPSSVVKGFLELMMRQGEAAYSAEQWHFLTSAFESNEQLIEVSKSLLNMARLEGGLIEPDIREFDPGSSLQRKIASFSPIYQTKRVTVSFAASGEVEHIRSDESFFLEVFGILLGNAIKHSPIGSEIKVSCDLSATQCEVHVMDNGPGISPEVRAKLFNSGQEASSDENSHGLGLFMAKKYIALLGGTIGLEEQGTESSTDFYFTVPNLQA